MILYVIDASPSMLAKGPNDGLSKVEMILESAYEAMRNLIISHPEGVFGITFFNCASNWEVEESTPGISHLIDLTPLAAEGLKKINETIEGR